MLATLEQHGYPTGGLRVMARGELATLKHANPDGSEIVRRFDGIELSVRMAQECA